MPIAGLYEIFNHWHAEGTVYIYSDPHFDDPDLKKGIVRPDAEELVKLINSKCGRKDTLIILGDICNIEYVKKIRAKYKILVCGNHDAGATNYKRQRDHRLFDKENFTTFESIKAEAHRLYPGYQINIQETPDSWVVNYDNHLFDEIYTGCLMISEKIILSHEPIENLPSWLVNLHGHDHTGRRTDKQHFNFCADVIGYVPVNFNQWMKEGHLAKIESIHRGTIDKATERKKKRGGKKLGGR